MKRFCRILAMAVSLCALGAVSAHTSVSGTTPADGAVLERSPPAVEIRFAEAARITSVAVTGEDRAERRLAFEPRGPATVFTLPDPKLTAGRNQIRWKALSRDGHVIEGALVLTIEPGGGRPKPDASDQPSR